MKIKYEQENFSIEGMTPKQVSKSIRRKSKTSDFWYWMTKKHEINYVTNYLGALLLDDKTKTFFKNTTTYDLFNIYYIDFIIKNDLLVICQKIERYLKVSILQEVPHTFLKEESKTFGSKIEFFSKGKIENSQRMKIMGHFEKIVNTQFETLSEFEYFLQSVRRIRNFSAHGFNKAKYYEWNSELFNKQYRMLGKYKFKSDFSHLLMGATRGSIVDLKRRLIDIFENRPFSTDEIGVLVCKKYFGSNTVYSFEWNNYIKKNSEEFSLNKFLQANSRNKNNKNRNETSVL